MNTEGLWRFDPWNMGTPDARLNGVKLLVVAESHYREGRALDDFHRDETQRVIEEHVIASTRSSARSPLFENVASTLAEGISHIQVWRSIYFYNYFQRPMDTPSESPLTSDYAEAALAFDALLRHLNPQAILIMSARVWRYMRNDCVMAGECALGAIYDFTGMADLRIPGAHTHHPSARRPRFDPSRWRPGVAEFLNYVRRTRSIASLG